VFKRIALLTDVRKRVREGSGKKACPPLAFSSLQIGLLAFPALHFLPFLCSFLALSLLLPFLSKRGWDKGEREGSRR